MQKLEEARALNATNEVRQMLPTQSFYILWYMYVI